VRARENWFAAGTPAVIKQAMLYRAEQGQYPS
jgi:hypothetical protein